MKKHKPQEKENSKEEDLSSDGSLNHLINKKKEENNALKKLLEELQKTNK